MNGTMNQTPQAPAARSDRPTRVAEVTAAGRAKTVKARIEFLVRHAKYGKMMRRTSVLHVHDEKNESGVGDKIEIMECRPISKTKSWRLVRVLQKAPSGETP